MPCGTFSTARDHGKTDGSEPRRLRGTTPETVLKPERYCTQRERQHVMNGNRVLYRMLDIIRLCISEKVSWYIENPKRSRLWMVPQITALTKLPGANFCQFDYCQFGTTYQKETFIPQTVLALGVLTLWIRKLNVMSLLPVAASIA